MDRGCGGCLGCLGLVWGVGVGRGCGGCFWWLVFIGWCLGYVGGLGFGLFGSCFVLLVVVEVFQGVVVLEVDECQSDGCVLVVFVCVVEVDFFVVGGDDSEVDVFVCVFYVVYFEDGVEVQFFGVCVGVGGEQVQVVGGEYVVFFFLYLEEVVVVFFQFVFVQYFVGGFYGSRWWVQIQVYGQL